MSRFVLLLALLAGAAAPAHAAAAGSGSVAAVQKVIQMLGDMSAKTKQEKNDEQVAFGEFKTWCSHEKANLSDEIKKNAETIDLLTAEVDKLASEIKGHGAKVADLQQGVAKHEGQKKAEHNQRAKDHEAFLAESADFSESVDALDRAITLLKKEDYDRPGSAAALLQISQSERIPAKVRSIVAAFVGMVGGDKDESPLGGTDYSAPEANAYEFQSTSIVELLKKLQDQFREKLGESQKAEMNSKHASAMIVQDLTDSIENKNKEAEETTMVKERKTEKKAQDEKHLADTEALKAENEKMLEETTTECEEKTMSFQEKQQLRTEEIEAIAKAVEILSSDDVSGNAEKHLALAQAKVGTALLQLSSRDTAVEKSEGIRRRVREFLEGEGRRLHSDRLTLLAEKMGADPFGKVKKMIDGMITRLLEEAKGDAEHEGFCDTEMGKSKITRNKLTEEIDALTAACEDGKATVMQLTETIATLSQEVADLDRSVEEATSLRTAEKAKNEATVKDAKDAQKAVAAATSVLKDFYQKASTATAFVQLRRAPSPRQWGLKTGVKMGSEEWNALANPNFEGSVDKGHKDGMQTFGEVETGKQSEAQYGVLGLLEIIMSDFASLEADTNAAEAASAEAHERFMVESKKNKAVKTRSIDMNTADKAAAEAKLTTDTADLKSTQDELLAAERYYDKLAPQCIDNGMTFEERTAARAAEIASLKEALKILSSKDIA